ncbi:divalent metal cation transporter [Balneolaceae bacterium YR4-1]|uniref:Divalent metal cation transporter n=1 Tax=Halalkalibaculum roseum TaxID=2709311 RepID=A0A6M1SSK3_9BACT|nr:divalent metal cation transporter [Halalkalibaculum roseum]NGP78039.1 divalent metal cation transporter [Halalkalibaculum roseum]
MRKRLLNILFWSVLSAAFIGPGTITTAASAGTGFGFTLLWALLFSTIACIILQEASARLTLSSGKNLGEAMKLRFQESLAGKITGYLVLISILLGCAAYEAGNILGGVAGAALISNVPAFILTLIIGLVAFLLLWFGSTKVIAQILGIIVAIMGFCFFTTAILMKPPIDSILNSALIPRFPTGSEILIIGLIGTTVVPYNLFLGSGIKHTQNIKEMRFSLTAAIILGGIISMAVLIVGTSISGEFTYDALAGSLGDTLGSWASLFFGIGLFAAGLSSALTAPLAAALTAKGFMGSESDENWKDAGTYMKLVWGSVLMIGVFFGVLQVQPIPAIILAQALNGIILPFVTIFLLLVMNDASLLNRSSINSHAYNLLMGIIVFTTLVIGLTNVAKALNNISDAALVNEEYILYAATVIALFVAWPVIHKIKEYRKR